MLTERTGIVAGEVDFRHNIKSLFAFGFKSLTGKV